MNFKEIYGQFPLFHVFARKRATDNCASCRLLLSFLHIFFWQILRTPVSDPTLHLKFLTSTVIYTPIESQCEHVKKKQEGKLPFHTLSIPLFPSNNFKLLVVNKMNPIAEVLTICYFWSCICNKSSKKSHDGHRHTIPKNAWVNCIP